MVEDERSGMNATLKRKHKDICDDHGSYKNVHVIQIV